MMVRMLEAFLILSSLLGVTQAGFLRARNLGPVDCRDDLGSAALGNVRPMYQNAVLRFDTPGSRCSVLHQPTGRSRRRCV